MKADPFGLAMSTQTEELVLDRRTPQRAAVAELQRMIAVLDGLTPEELKALLARCDAEDGFSSAG